MVSRREIDEFLAQRSLALVGVSRGGKGFGNAVRRELTQKGYSLHLVHHRTDSIEGQPCASCLQEVGPLVGGVVLVTPPEATLRLVREAAAAGIRRIWMQQGAESEEAVRFCEENGLSVIHGQCIMMFAEPAGAIHRFHRWVRKLMKRLPA